VLTRTAGEGSEEQLRVEERWAQVCIQNALPDCKVEPHDDGSEPSMYDLKIVNADGSTGAVEVTTAVDDQRLELWQEVRKRALIRQEPGLIGGWLVRILHSARARDLDKQLVGLLGDLERNGRTTVRGIRGSTDVFEARLSSLGVIEAVQAATDRKGSIYIMPPEGSLEQMGGYAPVTGDLLAVWLGDWTNEPTRSDNVRKLESADTTERHLFILVRSITTVPFAVNDLLFSPEAPFPTIPPVLPAGVTDVWVMSTWDSGGGFRWSSETGWIRFTKVPPPSPGPQEAES
jgi:hypothetical protein